MNTDRLVKYLKETEKLTTELAELLKRPPTFRNRLKAKVKAWRIKNRLDLIKLIR